MLCGAAALFRERALIRWMGSSIRVVAYYSNFILISAFFGLGAGALTVRYNIRLRKFIFVILGLCVLGSPLLGSAFDLNPSGEDEFVWLGSPRGVVSRTLVAGFEILGNSIAPYWLVLTII